MSTLDTALDSLSRVDPRLILVALLFHLANFGFRSAGWRNILRAAYPDRPVPLLGIAGAYAAGVALNSFMPARGGDAAKVVLVRARIPGSSVPTIVSSMGVVSLLDALIGGVAIAVLSAFGLLPSPPGLPQLPGVAPLVGRHVFVAIPAVLALLAAAVLLGRRFGPKLLGIWAGLKAGTAILKTPRRYATEVVPLQLSAWVCRIGAAYFLLGAFGVPATISSALIVVVAGGLSTLIPTPGGVGTQQLFVAYFLQATASTATLVTFSLGMQATITALNVVIGVTATMLMLRTLRPARALRAQVRGARVQP